MHKTCWTLAKCLLFSWHSCTLKEVSMFNGHARCFDRTQLTTMKLFSFCQHWCWAHIHGQHVEIGTGPNWPDYRLNQFLLVKRINVSSSALTRQASHRGLIDIYYVQSNKTGVQKHAAVLGHGFPHILAYCSMSLCIYFIVPVKYMTGYSQGHWNL